MSNTCGIEVYGAGVDSNDITLQTFSVNYYDESDMPCSLNNDLPFGYTNVWMIPSDQVSLYRRKWNYIRNLFQQSYSIDVDGNWVDTRTLEDAGGPCDPTPNMAKRLDVNTYEHAFYDDLLSWCSYMAGRTAGAIFEEFLQWRYKIGGTLYGNLPQHKRDDHDGHCWMPCPYSTDSSAERTTAMLGFNVAGKTDHDIYYMKTQSKGSIWGYECTSDTCPYYLGENKRYFYV